MKKKTITVTINVPEGKAIKDIKIKPVFESIYPKDGEFYHSKTTNSMFIYNGKGMDKTAFYVALVADRIEEGKNLAMCGDSINLYRLATTEEIEYFLNKMHAVGRDWDAKNKKVVDYIWIPKYGECYQSITFDTMNGEFCTYKQKWYDNKIDHSNMRLGWVKPRNESSEATLQQLCDKLNKAIKNIK